MSYKLLFPDQFDTFAWEVEAKGWNAEIKLVVDRVYYSLTFFDQERLRQEISDELVKSSFFLEKNLIVLEKVTKTQIEYAVSKLMSEGLLPLLVPN